MQEFNPDLVTEHASELRVSSMEKIKCPFCGGEAMGWHEFRAEDGYSSVMDCPRCGRFDE